MLTICCSSYTQPFGPHNAARYEAKQELRGVVKRMDFKSALPQVQGALMVLYGGASAPSRIQEANAFLMKFQTSPAAWEVAQALLKADAVQVRYFAANILLGKV